MAVAIAAALKIPISELAGMPAHRVKISGSWWASWQTFRDGVEKIATQEVELNQEGELIQVSTLSHGLSMKGRWVGIGYDDKIMTGWGSMARTHTEPKPSSPS